MDETTKAYIAGFFDGEGTLTMAYGHKANHREKTNDYSHSYSPVFQLVFANSDSSIIEQLQVWLQCGAINHQKPRGVSRKPMTYLRIYVMDDIQRVIDLILPYTRLKRKYLEIAQEAIKGMLAYKTIKTRKWSNEALIFFAEELKKMDVAKTSFGSLQKRFLRPELVEDKHGRLRPVYCANR
jgi:hypothetical protein